jgi:hypothetical protein
MNVIGANNYSSIAANFAYEHSIRHQPTPA